MLSQQASQGVLSPRSSGGTSITSPASRQSSQRQAPLPAEQPQARETHANGESSLTGKKQGKINA